MAESGELPPVDDVNDIIVRYVISNQLRRKGYQWPAAVCATSQDTQDYQQVCESMDNLCEEFRTQFRDRLVQMSEELKISSFSNSMAFTEFSGVVNELFREGIKWSRIIAMFAFGVQLAEHCFEKGHAEYVDNIVRWMTSYLAQLQTWINDHGGWEGVRTFADDRRNSNSPWPDLNLVAGIAAGAAVLGAIAIGAVMATK